MNSQNSISTKSALVVCGKFHYFNYAAELESRGPLKQFIYSHRIQSSRRFKSQKSFTNLFTKEYLFQLHQRLFGDFLANTLHPIYHWQWDVSAAALLKRVDVLHILMHGNCPRTLIRARSMNIRCIGEAVNSHPNDYLNTLEQEHADLGLAGKCHRPKFVSRILDEIPQVDKVLVPSDFVAKSYLHNGVPADKIHKIAYGANLEEFTPASVSPDKFRVICVAQVALRKGHQYLLRAWKRLNFPNAELHCYGFIDPLVLDCLYKIGASNVFFHGSVGKNKLISEIQKSSVFILPSVEEGFAVSILEALACGLPVITTTHSGAEGVISNNENGLLITPRDIDAICESLDLLYRDRQLCKQIGIKGRELVEGKYNWHLYVDNLIRLYCELNHNS